MKEAWSTKVLKRIDQDLVFWKKKKKVKRKNQEDGGEEEDIDVTSMELYFMYWWRNLQWIYRIYKENNPTDNLEYNECRHHLSIIQTMKESLIFSHNLSLIYSLNLQLIQVVLIVDSLHSRMIYLAQSNQTSYQDFRK